MRVEGRRPRGNRIPAMKSEKPATGPTPQKMRNLSKSKLLAFRQCPKRLWLEMHRPDLRQDSIATQASFDVGHHVGAIARRLYDPEGRGQMIDLQLEGVDAAIGRSTQLLALSHPIFESGFAAGGALAFADVMLPTRRRGQRAWRMIEVKSSTRVKGYHRDDAAIQAFVATGAGVNLASVELAHVDSAWTYPGADDYRGLLVENDLTEEALSRAEEVKTWISGARTVVRMTSEPVKRSGKHCQSPNECGFLSYCQSAEPKAEYPVHWLPRIRTKAFKVLIDDEGLTDLRQIPNELLNERQLRVKTATLSGEFYFDSRNAASDLSAHKLPAYFLDFETIQFVVPTWKHTRPYQRIPFQFSVHRLSRFDKLSPQAFVDLSGNDPSTAFAESLIGACGDHGPVFVYNAGFEKSRIKELAERFPRLDRALLAINERIVDLLRIAEQRYYHPSQQGSWSIKKVLPAIAPDLRYDALEGVQNGGLAMEAYREAISSQTTANRKAQIKQQLLDYCALDTLAMVRMWKLFAGRDELVF